MIASVEPNLVANASLVTVDVAFTLTAVLSLAAAFALGDVTALEEPAQHALDDRTERAAWRSARGTRPGGV